MIFLGFFLMLIMNFRIFRVLLLINFIEFNIANRSCSVNDFPSQKFKLLKRRAKSEDHVLIRRKIPTLEKCLELAISKKGLALNFSQINRKKQSIREHFQGFNCQILGCPEIDSLNSLIEDKKFNYYSAYSRKRFGNETAGCLPRIGLFVTIMKPQNWTNAQLECQKMNGKLANVISSERTEGFSKLISKKTPVFVGLSNRGKERYWKNEFEKRLECFEYRGWSQGEPASRGCVALIRSEVHRYNHTFWKVFPCSEKFPFICEILPRINRLKTNNSTRLITNYNKQIEN